MMPPFKRVYKRLHNRQKVAVDGAVAAIVSAPEIGAAKRGDLLGVYVHRFDCVGQQYLLAYEWTPDLRVLRALGVHENFYRDHKREVLEKLRAGHAEIQGRFEVERLGLFGSAARDELREDSDVDILVKFHGPTRYDSYCGLQQALEALLGRRVDLVTESGLKPRARAGVARDLIHVA